MQEGVRQTGWMRGVLVAAAVCLLLVAGLLISLTVFLNGQGLRERIEAALSHALGRSVRMDSLQFSLATGSAVAHGLRVADDPRFGTEPFVQAAHVRLGLALWPLLSRRQVQIGSVELHHPQIRLQRNASGVWNYASFGARSSSTADQPIAPVPGAPHHSSAALAISRISVVDGEVLVRLVAAANTPEDRVYDGVELQITQFDVHHAVPFRVGAHLPAGGVVQANGTAGPFDRDTTAATPVIAHVNVTHLDLAAAGLVKTASRVAGVIQNVSADLSWNGDSLHVQRITADTPVLHIGVAHTVGPGPAHPSVWRQLLQRLQVDAAAVHGGTVTFDRSDGSHLTARACDVAITHWAGATPANIALTAGVAGGTVHAAGTFAVLPEGFAPSRLAANLQLKLHGIDLPGVLPRGSPLRGTADADLNLVDTGGGWTIDGRVKVDRLVLARNGQPAPAPVLANVHVQQLPPSNGVSTGIIHRSELSFGGASAQVAGAYRLGHPATLLNLNIAAQGMPIDGVESFLPVAGVQLPEKSRLSGGTLSLALHVQGTPASLTADGPVHAEATRLDGFDLGSKLASLARFTGDRLGSTGTSGTVIRSIRFQLRTGGGQTSTDDLAADVAGIGKISGSGTVGEGAALHYRLLLKLEEVTAGAGGGASLARGIASALPAGWAARALGIINGLASGAMRHGIPLLVGGTAKHPTVTPDLGALFPAEKPAPAPAPSPWATPKSDWPPTQK